MKIDDFKELLYKRCCEVGTKVAETKGKQILKKEKDEIFNLIFSEIGWFINRNVINGKELVEVFTADELFSVGFLTQENNPIDFSKIVSINGVNWFNENEPCGIVNIEDVIVEKDVQLTKKEYHQRCPDYEECRGKEDCMGFADLDKDDELFREELPILNIKLPKTKRLPTKSELESLLNCKQNLGYYNDNLCKIYDNKLVLPFHSDVGCYLSYMGKPLYDYAFLTISSDRIGYVSDQGYEQCFIRCVENTTTLKPSSKKIIESPNKQVVSKKTINEGDGNYDTLKQIIETKGVLEGTQYYRNSTGVSLTEAKKYVDGFIAKNNIKVRNSGCAGVILLLILLTGTFFIL